MRGGEGEKDHAGEEEHRGEGEKQRKGEGAEYRRGAETQRERDSTPAEAQRGNTGPLTRPEGEGKGIQRRRSLGLSQRESGSMERQGREVAKGRR